MNNFGKIGVVIPAAGSGKRMGASIPKQYMEIDGEPMVFKSLWAFTACEAVDEIVVAAGADWIDYCSQYISQADDAKKNGKVIRVVAGGDERYDSVYAGLVALGDDVKYVLVHDGARPFVSQEVIGRVIEAMLGNGAAIPCVRPKDTIRREAGVLKRDELYAVQTPQGFRKGILMEAYEDAKACGFTGTDDASYVENLGIRVAICEGDYGNIKVTTREDLPMEMKIGSGFDVHRFAPEESSDNFVVLGGVKIPYERKLMAHSDGDVLIHAVMDALLGAAGLGDIGKLFPDTDPAFKDASSMGLLEEVGSRLKEKGLAVVNIDATLIGQEPKISPHREAMAENMASALGIDPARVNVKGTTTEKLGFTGRKEGLAAEAVCMLKG